MNFLLKVKEFFKTALSAIKTAYQTKKWLGIVSAIVGVAVVATSIALPIALSDNNDENSDSSVPTESSSSLVGDSSSSETPDSSFSAPDHEHVFVDMVTEATCKQQGYTTYTCQCGESYVAEYVDMLPHTPVVDKAVEPTCTETGLTEGSHCDVCGDTIIVQEPVKANGHVWGRWQETKPATEQAKGEKRRDCNNCTEFETSPIAELSHSHDRYEVIILPAVEQNCIETGLTEGKKCSGCQEILVAQEVISADGHNEVIDAAVPATCTETGLTEGKHCDVCHEVLVAQTTVNALDHDREFHAKQAPACTEIGWDDYYTCKRMGCDYTTYVEKPALNHLEVVDPAVAPTCVATGLTEGKHCGRCPEILVAQQTIAINPSAHDKELHTKQDPTCTEIGWDDYYTCKRTGCNYTTYVEKPAFNHMEVIDAAVAPTCTTTGLTEGKHCDVCEEVLIAQTSVNALGHDKEFHTKQAPTCTEFGWDDYYTCKRMNCDYSTYQEKPALDHNYVNNVCTRCFDEKASEGLAYTLSNDGTYYSVSKGTCTDTHVVIPSTHENKPVKEIGHSAFYRCSSLRSVIIGNSVQSIDNSAFEECISLQSVIIPDSVKTIKNSTFSKCYNLKSVTIGNSVQFIGDYAFYFCASLQSVTIGNSVQFIGDYAFYFCDFLQSVTIPNSVQFIGFKAFENCDFLQSVTFKNTSGWYVTKTENATSGTDISSTDLANKSTAATYLKDTYVAYHWYRKTN